MTGIDPRVPGAVYRRRLAREWAEVLRTAFSLMTQPAEELAALMVAENGKAHHRHQLVGVMSS